MKKLRINSDSKKTFEDFIKSRMARNLRDKSIKTYTDAWIKFNKYYKGSLYNITQDDIENYILELKNKIKATSINSYLRHLRTICIYFDLDVKITLLKVDHEFKTPYTIEEIQKLLVKPNMKTELFTYYRDWVIINLFLATGARAGTVVNIKICDVDLDNKFIGFTLLKNRKVQKIPIPNILVEILNEYISIRNGSKEDFLFCDHYGKPLTVNGLAQSIKNYNHSRGVYKRGLHLFRHTFAKEYIKNGGDILTFNT